MESTGHTRLLEISNKETNLLMIMEWRIIWWRTYQCAYVVAKIVEGKLKDLEIYQKIKSSNTRDFSPHI